MIFWFGVVQGHRKWRRSINHVRLSWSAVVSVYLYLVPFSSYLALNNIATLKSRLGSFKVIGNGTIRKLGYSFLFAFYSNYGSVLCCF